MLLLILIGFVSILLGLGVLLKWMPSNKVNLSTTQAKLLDAFVYSALSLFAISIVLWAGWGIRLVNFRVFRVVFAVGLLTLLSLYPINRFFKNYENRVNFKTLSASITYLVLAIGVIPMLNIPLFQAINPILGFEREVIFQSEDFVMEKQEGIIKSGGQNRYVIYGKSTLGDVWLDDVMGYRQEYENEAYWLSAREKLR